MLLTRNFAAHEFDRHEPWPADKAANRQALADRLQWVRDRAGVPVEITSAWRSPDRNDDAGGSSTSQHMRAEAVDAWALLIPFRKLAELLLEDVRAGRAPAFGQLIFYPREGHIHLSLPTLGARNGELRYKNDAGAIVPLTSAKQLPMFSAAQRGRGLHRRGALAAARRGARVVAPQTVTRRGRR